MFDHVTYQSKHMYKPTGYVWLRRGEHLIEDNLKIFHENMKLCYFVHKLHEHAVKSEPVCVNFNAFLQSFLFSCCLLMSWYFRTYVLPKRKWTHDSHLKVVDDGSVLPYPFVRNYFTILLHSVSGTILRHCIRNHFTLSILCWIVFVLALEFLYREIFCQPDPFRPAPPTMFGPDELNRMWYASQRIENRKFKYVSVSCIWMYS